MRGEFNMNDIFVYPLQNSKEYKDIIPGYYMNKIHWNSIIANGNVSENTVKELLDKSYNEILSKLSKRKREEILK